MAMRHLQGGYAYPIKKKLASIQKTISQPKWHASIVLGTAFTAASSVTSSVDWRNYGRHGDVI